MAISRAEFRGCLFTRISGCVEVRIVNVIKYELRKIFSSWVVWGLIGAVILINGLLIFSQAPFLRRDELAVVTEMVRAHGSEVTDETLAIWRTEYERLLQQVNLIAEQEVGVSFSTIGALLNSEYAWSIDGLFESDAGRELSQRALIIESHYLTARSIEDNYYNVRLVEYGQRVIEDFVLTGALAQTILDQFETAQVRLDTLVENGEHLHFFFNNEIFDTHIILFQRIFGAISIGTTILVVVISAFLFNYEFDQKTDKLIYSTTCGRRLQLLKLKTACLAVTMITFLIIALTLGLYFLKFNYRGLWHVPMSSAFMSDSRFVITAYSLTFLQYLFAVIGMIYMGQLLFVWLTFILSKLIRRGYLSTILFFILLVLGRTGSMFFPSHSNLVFYAGFNPFFMLFRDLSGSFLLGAISESYRHFELMTISVWAIIFSLGVVLSYHQFKRRDL